MEIGEFLRPDQVVVGLRVTDKAHLTAELSRRSASALGIDGQQVEAALTARERLGSTGLGNGFALPHARLDGIDRFFGLFARLERPIDFEAIDGRAVNLVFLLLIPGGAGNGHVAALAAVSRRLRNREVVQQLRNASSAAQMYAVLTDGSA